MSKNPKSLNNGKTVPCPLSPGSKAHLRWWSDLPSTGILVTGPAPSQGRAPLPAPPYRDHHHGRLYSRLGGRVGATHTGGLVDLRERRRHQMLDEGCPTISSSVALLADNKTMIAYLLKVCPFDMVYRGLRNKVQSSISFPVLKVIFILKSLTPFPECTSLGDLFYHLSPEDGTNPQHSMVTSNISTEVTGTTTPVATDEQNTTLLGPDTSVTPFQPHALQDASCSWMWFMGWTAPDSD